MKRKRTKRTRNRNAAYKHPGNLFVPIVEKAKHSVITIRAKEDGGSQPFHEYLYSLLFPDEERDTAPARSVGSGFIIHPDGYILTSEHVIHDTSDIKVKLYNGEQFTARPVWADEKRDIGIIKISARRTLRPLPIGSSEKSKVGELVISIGNPLGLEHTITTGVISAKNRQVRISNKIYEDVIQTDCAINPGNSGGPLINLNGKVIGMNAFIVKDNQGLGFAIGIDSIKGVIGKFLP